jgi:tetratricopeptide (TPR) repeat protein
MVQATDQGAELAAEFLEYQKKKMIDSNIILMFGHLLLEMGEYGKAMKYFDNILNSSNPNDEEIACIYFNFGRTHRAKQNFSEAINCYTRAYDLHANAKPQRLASAAKVLNGLGIVYCDLEKQEQAMQCFQKASKLLRKSVRRKHVDVAATLINLSTIQYDRKEVREQKQTFDNSFTNIFCVRICSPVYEISK